MPTVKPLELACLLFEFGFEFGEEEEGVEGLELVEVGSAEGVEDRLVDHGECGSGG